MSVLPRTAVVIVHGIGEQQPFATLRSFVGSGLPSSGLLEPADEKHCFVAPDTLTGATYARRLTLDHTHRVERIDSVPDLPKKRYSRTTHFFEYFWAHRFRDTKWRHLGTTLSRLIRTQRSTLEQGSVSGGRSFAYTALRLLSFIALLCVSFLTAMGVWAIISPADGNSVVWAVGAFCASVLAVFCGNYAGLLTAARVSVGVPLFAIAGGIGGYLLTVPDNPLQGTVLAVAVILALASALLWMFRLGRMSIVFLITSAATFAIGSVGAWEEVLSFGELLQSTVVTIVAVLPALLGGFALRSFGDAARYLSNAPDDVEDREAIRSGLVDMLRKLEEQRDPNTGRPTYDRVVLIGHSLGGVIAYDALTAYWSLVNNAMLFPDRGKDERLYPIASAIAHLEHSIFEEASLAKDRSDQSIKVMSPAERDEWERSQATLQAGLRAEVRWENNRLVSTPQRWIVTDFVTVGSPLSHADVLLADGIGGLRRANADRLLPTDPPSRQSTQPAQQLHPFRFRSPLGSRYVTRLHHAAVFAATTWTNLYFTHDLVGGALASRLGGAIRDIELAGRPPRLWAFLRAFPHSSYWGTGKKNVNAIGTAESIEAIRGIAIRQTTVLLLTGTPQQVKDLRARIYESFVEGIPPAGMKDKDCFELRVLRRSIKSSPSRAWTWLGFDPWFKVDDLPKMIEIAKELGLSTVLSDGHVVPDAETQNGGEPADVKAAPEPSDEENL